MKERCCARCFILLLPLLLFLISCACAAGITCEINPAGSSWIPGESALFEGCISADGTVSSDSATMKLSIRTDPVLSDPGTIVFSEVNGKKLSIRNQKDEYTVSLQAGSEIRFSGSWLIPENIHVSDIALVLTVLGPDGSILDEVSAPVSGNVSGSGPSGTMFPDLAAPIRYVLLAAAAVWILAAVRILIHQKRSKQK
ncbi:hypothetical protein JNO48_01115 [Clostridiales bacterium]|nr:hypothetical protein JNO48_01115 [Clostridiales bacterium]